MPRNGKMKGVVGRGNTPIVSAKTSKCRVVNCRKKSRNDDPSLENVCDHHRRPVIRFDNQKKTCSLKGCGKKMRSSGYCTKHSPDKYSQRIDLLPEYINTGAVSNELAGAMLLSVSPCRYCANRTAKAGVCAYCWKKINKI